MKKKLFRYYLETILQGSVKDIKDCLGSIFIDDFLIGYQTSLKLVRLQEISYSLARNILSLISH